MANVIEIDKNLYNTLVDSFGQEILKEKINTFLISALENQLEKYSREILTFEKNTAPLLVNLKKCGTREKLRTNTVTR